jgi:phenylalanyl-tRNA synthetase alpha chain
MDDLSTIRSEALGAVEQAADLAALDAARVAVLGKKGSVTGLMKTLGSLAPAERREFGARVNQLKGEIEAALEARKSALATSALAAKLANERIDVSLPARPEGQGTLHPIGQVMDELAAIFGEMGFTWAEGPDIEDDWHNFTALNIPPDHPARQMQDTCAPTPRRCRRAPCSTRACSRCWPTADRCASSCPAVPSASTATPPTPRCSTRSRGW